ncbi:MAG: hypothetical protein ACLPVY_26650 [Acidimicrobiia bacterium]
MLSTVKSTGAEIGGGVEGVPRATVSIAATFSIPGNRATLATSKTSGPTKGTGASTWDTVQTSTFTVTLTSGTGVTATHAQFAKYVTVGLLEGSKLSGSVVPSIPAGSCQQTAPSKVTFKQLTALVIA